ncbi:hypothetical protein Taro_016181 [Colocasia esculenta]|uniref:Uncharacterized protein n=1 Tax=Colocasia esculenta TaxID=4460 RepID=A0A843UPE2_COLES|nr:hypothetical protein [Colocasia esculenta]
MPTAACTATLTWTKALCTKSYICRCLEQDPPPPPTKNYHHHSEVAATKNLVEDLGAAKRLHCKQHHCSCHPHTHGLAAVGLIHAVRAHFLDYFNATLQACTICGSVLHSIEQLRHARQILQRLILGTAAAYNIDCIVLPAYVELEKLLSSLATSQFCGILDVYASLIQRLVLARNKVFRRARLSRLAKRTSAVTLMVACGAPATVVLVVRAHAVGFLVVALALGVSLGWPVLCVVQEEEEGDGQMVARLHDEVEHWKEVVRLFLRSGEGWVLQEYNRPAVETSVLAQEIAELRGQLQQLMGVFQGLQTQLARQPAPTVPPPPPHQSSKRSRPDDDRRCRRHAKNVARSRPANQVPPIAPPYARMMGWVTP